MPEHVTPGSERKIKVKWRAYPWWMIEGALARLYGRRGERIYFAWLNGCWRCLWRPFHD